MDVAALSITLNQSSVKQAASLATVKTAMNTATNNAEGIVDLLKQAQAVQQSAQPHLGGTIYLKV
ncbi:hypothetical protein FHS15_003818 [Paenibacillus castaneae]|uniref:YjfB family protein n=1 Tax=Paenibacillus castaneae TaxID=474957 RepID=UPI000C9B79B7|nr:YjfB family protein [Paenibacillus castaneae]NIK78672.1 hypothetical protein [Paenibacillus castaneae]